jgi:hypothetical protein
MLFLLSYPLNILFFIFALNGVKLGSDLVGVKSLKIFKFFSDSSKILLRDLDLSSLSGVSINVFL